MLNPEVCNSIKLYGLTSNCFVICTKFESTYQHGCSDIFSIFRIYRIYVLWNACWFRKLHVIHLKNTNSKSAVVAQSANPPFLCLSLTWYYVGLSDLTEGRKHGYIISLHLILLVVKWAVDKGSWGKVKNNHNFFVIFRHWSGWPLWICAKSVLWNFNWKKKIITGQVCHF